MHSVVTRAAPARVPAAALAAATGVARRACTLPTPPLPRWRALDHHTRRTLATQAGDAAAAAAPTDAAAPTTAAQPAAADAPASTASPLAHVLNQVSHVQGVLGESHAAWLERVAAARTLHDSPFSVAVVGDSGSHHSAVIAALLDQSLESLAIARGSQQLITKISFGAKPIETPAPANQDGAALAPAPAPAATGPIRHLRSQSAWLSDNNAEIYSIKGFDAAISHRRVLDDILLKSDAVVLVTSPERDLTGSVDQLVVNELLARGKQNVFVAVVRSSGSGASAAAVASHFEAKLAADLLRTKSPRLVEPKLPTIISVTETSSSGAVDVSEITKTLTTLARNPEKAKLSTIEFVAWSALQHVSLHHADAGALIAGVHQTVKAIAKRIVEHEQRLVRDFRGTDLGVVQSTIVDLTEAFKAYFAKTPFWKLFWRSDFLADDLRARMRAHSLLHAEYRMTYAAGKTNEALVQLNQQLIDNLEPLTVSTHGLAQHPITAMLQDDIARMLAIVRKQIPPAGSAIDPFLLRNEVASFDESAQCDKVQSLAERLVQRQLAAQVVFYLSALLAVHFGVPALLSGTYALTASVMAFAWMQLRWRSIQNRFINSISASQKTLKSRLSTAYDNEFTRVVAAPLAVSIKMIEEAAQQRAAEVAAAVDNIEEISESIRREIYKRDGPAKTTQ
ncbi:hypothetical protein HK105_204170 [Polyrhizophydium stewartii]|uniref:Mmc1 C-terminal domain-containing protein n=1 Tax=Polyrhizophydium stewartii TaxID=2732419 RepID=A0ABR4NAD4_9FUNG|nr:hypothetical protein HK105_000505 [Polyrhizophydium stewartii]